MAAAIKISVLAPTTYGAMQTDGQIPVSKPDVETYRLPVAQLASAAQGARADSAYQKPTSGIPKTDLDSTVQASLSKADSAIQSTEALATVAALEAEAAARQTADGALSDAIEAEASAREAAIANAAVTSLSYAADIHAVKAVKGDGTTLPAVLPIASEDDDGLMPKQAYEKLQEIADDVTRLNGGTKVIRIGFSDIFGTDSPTTQDILDYLGTLTPPPTPESVRITDIDTKNVWVYKTDTNEFINAGADTVSVFTNDAAGVVKGSSVAGQVFAEMDGTGSVVGWDALNSKVDTIDADLGVESAARQSADSGLASDIDAEATTRANADTALSGRIDAEATTRGNADTALSGRIDAEATTRGNADTTLSGRIDTETAARIAGDEESVQHADSLQFTTNTPDYANQDATNRISTSGGTWTVDRDGFVKLYYNYSGAVNTTYTANAEINRVGGRNKTVRCVNFWPSQSIDEYMDLRKHIDERMATMTVAGSAVSKDIADDGGETGANDIEREQIKKSLTIIQNNIADIEQETLGLNHLSLEVFRQDLTGESIERYKSLPHGIFSGFKAERQGLIALLRHRKNNEKKIAFINEQGEEILSSRQEILQFLHANKDKPRYVPAPIEDCDDAETDKLSLTLRTWLETRIGDEIKAVMDGLFAGGQAALDLSAKQKAHLEETLAPDNWDLICWEVVGGD